jgi:N-acetyl-gamma-glutamyl-phosphate reductase
LVLVKVGIIGATGYAGSELVKIIHGHPGAELKVLTTQSYAGKPFWEVYPYLYKYVNITCEELDLPALVQEVDVVFTALPHGHAMPVAMETAKQGKRLIDLGADFRFKNYSKYEKWYKVEHTARELIEQAVYGLPELHREKIRGASIVGNPGCYPTSAILGLAPLMAEGLLDPDSLIIDSKSGVSGAGRGLSLGTLYCEVNENIKAYNIGIHRHTPEIEQELSAVFGREIKLSFTPHLTPMNRGILSTMYGNLTRRVDTMVLHELYVSYYTEEPFVRVLPPGMLPQTKAVTGSNCCDIAVTADPRTGRVVVTSAIDNLIKGASGQAVQNMNIMYGFKETTGIDNPGMYP